MITKQGLEHISLLSCIELTNDEKDIYTNKLNSILDYFGELDNADTEDIEPTYHIINLSNIFREDDNIPSIAQEEVLSNAAKKQDGFIKAPRMM